MRFPKKKRDKLHKISEDFNDVFELNFFDNVVKKLTYLTNRCEEAADFLEIINTQNDSNRWESSAKQWFIENLYEPLLTVVPGWIVCLTRLEKSETNKLIWNWVPGSGLTRDECEELTHPKKPFSPIFPGKKYRLINKWKDHPSILANISKQNNPNAWEGVVCIAPVRFDEIGCGFVIMPTISPFLFLGRFLPEKDSQNVMADLECLAKLFAETADYCQKELNKAITMVAGETREEKPVIQDILPNNSYPVSHLSADGVGSRNFKEDCPYTDALLRRFEAIQEELRLTRVSDPSARDEGIFSVSFLVKDRETSGYQWFLTTEQRESTKANIKNREQREMFYQRIFHTEAFYSANDTKYPYPKRYVEGMVGYAISRGKGPCFFSSPQLPLQFERACSGSDRLRNSRTELPPQLLGQLDSRYAEICSTVEGFLWKDHLTVEFEIGNSEELDLTISTSDHIMSAGLRPKKDSIVCVVQYDLENGKKGWQGIFRHLAKDIAVSRRHGQLAILEMQSAREADAKRKASERIAAFHKILGSLGHDIQKPATAVLACLSLVKEKTARGETYFLPILSVAEHMTDDVSRRSVAFARIMEPMSMNSWEIERWALFKRTDDYYLLLTQSLSLLIKEIFFNVVLRLFFRPKGKLEDSASRLINENYQDLEGKMSDGKTVIETILDILNMSPKAKEQSIDSFLREATNIVLNVNNNNISVPIRTVGGLDSPDLKYYIENGYKFRIYPALRYILDERITNSIKYDIPPKGTIHDFHVRAELNDDGLILVLKSRADSPPDPLTQYSKFGLKSVKIISENNNIYSSYKDSAAFVRDPEGYEVVLPIHRNGYNTIILRIPKEWEKDETV